LDDVPEEVFEGFIGELDTYWFSSWAVKLNSGEGELLAQVFVVLEIEGVGLENLVPGRLIGMYIDLESAKICRMQRRESTFLLLTQLTMVRKKQLRKTERTSQSKNLSAFLLRPLRKTCILVRRPRSLDRFEAALPDAKSV
jgi:hypothetical protein